MKTVVILQPGYLPWLGFFDQMRLSDVFVYYDDVQYDTHSWRNRNRIKSPSGPHWLTVPVLHKGMGKPRILDVLIDKRTPWAKKHVGTIKQFYAKAPFVKRYLPELEDVLMRKWEYLVDLDIEVAHLLSRWLRLEPQVVRSSSLKIGEEKSERLLEICKYFHAECYLSGDLAQNYLDTGLFLTQGIRVEWQHFKHPIYRQQHGSFLPQLSALDLILNEGEASAVILRALPAGRQGSPEESGSFVRLRQAQDDERDAASE